MKKYKFFVKKKNGRVRIYGHFSLCQFKLTPASLDLLEFCVLLLLELSIERERKMENHFFEYNFLFSILSTLYRLLYLQ